jgi:hypothetical protein
MNATFYSETMARQQEREIAAAAELRRRINERDAAGKVAPNRSRAFAREAFRRLRVRPQTV